MTRPIFIMCAGNAVRMGEELGYSKQFIRINGEPIIKRTLRLLDELGEDYPFLVVKKGEEKLYGGKAIFVTLSEYPYMTLLGNIYRAVNTVRLTESVQLTALLGDVCWSKPALRLVLERDATPFIAGRWEPSKVSGKPWDERFAIAGSGKFFGDFAHTKSLKKLPEGIPRLEIPADDFTEDIDFPHELTSVLPNLEILAKGT